MSVFRLMSYWINKALDHFKAQEMCDKKVENKPWSLAEVSDHFKAQ